MGADRSLPTSAPDGPDGHVRLAAEVHVLRDEPARDERRALRVGDDRHPDPGGVDGRDDHRPAELGGFCGGGIGVVDREDHAPLRRRIGLVVTHHVPTEWVKEHPDAPFTFVTDGVEAAVARAQQIARDRVVTVSRGTIARQALELGLLDEVAIDLVPVVMGEGNRPFFGKLDTEDVLLGNPTTCIQGDQVTHLVFPVTS